MFIIFPLCVVKCGGDFTFPLLTIDISPCCFPLFPFAYLWYNLDFAARIVALLIYLNLDSDAFLKFFYVGYDADMTTRLGGKREEGIVKILNIFNDIYRKGGRKLVDWK